MRQITIIIASDHRGFLLKEQLKKNVICQDMAITWLDVGAGSVERSDYPLFAQAVVHALQQGRACMGVLLCGSGIGMAIAANRYSGMYAGVAWCPAVARAAREDDNVNLLCLPADYLTLQEAIGCLASWLGASFKGGRYLGRLNQIDGR